MTRFSGRTAPPPTSVTPNVANWVTTKAYPHEVCSCGYWPGNGGYGWLRSTCMPIRSPRDTATSRCRTEPTPSTTTTGSFILPYDAVREARDPDALLLVLLQENYAAAADSRSWDRQALERREA